MTTKTMHRSLSVVSPRCGTFSALARWTASAAVVAAFGLTTACDDDPDFDQDGSTLDAKYYYDKTVAEAVAAGDDLSKTTIIAPQFFEGYPTGTWTNYYDWTGAAWRWGYNAKNHNQTSFGVVDHIVSKLMQNRPNLKTIVVAGQSAGGQFVNRYAVGTTVATPGVNMRFWSANPRMYMWNTADRPGPTCNGYNNYPYGVSNRTGYMANISPAQLRHNALTRDIYWTVGENDLDLDGECRTYAQGLTRYARWDNYRTHLSQMCSNAGYSWMQCLFRVARHIEIPDCGHGMSCSWKSETGHHILFDL